MDKRRKTPSIEVLKALYEEGLSMAKIGIRFGISSKQVWKHLHRAGVRYRDKTYAKIDMSKESPRPKTKMPSALKIKRKREAQTWLYCQRCAKKMIEYEKVMIEGVSINSQDTFKICLICYKDG